jgi:transcriptional regulator with XRE-family HTH domain
MVGERIKERRKALNLTQIALAEKSGVPQYHISALETGRVREIQSNTLRPLAQALRISSDWLLEIETPK